MGIMICPNCGGKVSTTRSDCPHCNYVFKKKICPDCNEEVLEDVKECPVCGHYFDEVVKEENSEIINKHTENLNSDLNGPKTDNDLIESKNEDNNSSLCSCPYCGSTDYLMIGKNYYLCTLCRMKFNSSANEDQSFKKEIIQQEEAHEKLKEETIIVDKNLATTEENVIQKNLTNNEEKVSVITEKQDTNTEKLKEETIIVDKKLAKTEENVIQKNLTNNEENVSVITEKTSSNYTKINFIFYIIITAVLSISFILLIIGCFANVEDSEYGNAMSYYTVGLADRLDYSNVTIEKIHLIFDEIIFFSMVICIVLLVVFNILSIVKFYKNKTELNLNSKIYFLIPVIMHLILFMIYMGTNNIEFGSVSLLIGLILYILSVISNEVFYLIKEKGISKATILFIIRRTSLFILSILAIFMLNNTFVDYYHYENPLMSLLIFGEPGATFLCYFSFVIGLALLVVSISFEFNRNKFKLVHYIPLVLGYVLLFVGMISVYSLDTGYLSSSFFVFLSLEFVFISAIIVIDYLQTKFLVIND